jgi:hypothetical protein
MLLAIGLLLTLVGTLMLSRALSRAAANSAGLGWMSEQWLAEQRASRPH